MGELNRWSKEKLIAYIENVQIKNKQLRKDKKNQWQISENLKAENAKLRECVEVINIELSKEEILLKPFKLMIIAKTILLTTKQCLKEIEKYKD